MTTPNPMPCTCTHRIIRYAKFEPEMPSIHYTNVGGPISPSWLTIAENTLGQFCHGGRTGFTLEYRDNDRVMLTLEEFSDLDHLYQTMARWHGPKEFAWVVCDMPDVGGDMTPWRD